MEPYKRKLEIKDLSLEVHLGCSEEERHSPQEVRVSLSLGFKEAPPGEDTDQLEDTVCYAHMCESLKKLAAEKSFHLVETLAKSSYQVLKPQIPENVGLDLVIHKVSPPVTDLMGGVHYHYGDSWA